MNILLSIVIHTANILGIFSDPFEFEGDYGPEVNPIRQQVFELVVSPEALGSNKSDRNYGPTLSQLVSSDLIEEIKKSHDGPDLARILHFIESYKDQKVFRFLRNNPPVLLNLDKTLRDKAAREGKSFDLPILGSTKPLEGTNSFELKRNLIEAVFTAETLNLAKPQADVKKALSKLDANYLSDFFGDEAKTEDLEAFSSPLGQVFFYWMYHALNLDLVATHPELIPDVNKVKEVFAKTLGDPVARANALKKKLMAANSGVLFTQESDSIVPQTLMRDGLFHPIDRQNGEDGTLVLLRSDIWEPDYEVISIDGYEGFNSGKLNLILATKKDSSQQFLLSSCHGNSTKPEDGRLQISLIMEKFHELNNGNLQLFIGIDANTKTEEDVNLFQEHLDILGFVSTRAGPTTIKKRMVTAQHSKAGRFAVDEEDYLITLKPELGGQFQFSHVTVGFKEEKPDINQPLPNIQNPSDHYPVGAEMVPFKN